jgi:DNA-binding MarR family transcriptional regulator
MSTTNLPTKDALLTRLDQLAHRSSNATVRYHQAVAERFGLNATDMKTIPLLLQTHPVSAGDLARSLKLTTGAITSVVDRLERAGLVRRIADPQDRRRVLIETIPEALDEAFKVYQPMAEAIRTLNARYSEEQLAIIVEYYEQTTEIMEREAASLFSASLT